MDRKNIRRFRLELVLLFLMELAACFHVPVLRIGNDSIGVFDIYIVMYAFWLLLRVDKRKYVFERKWKEYFIIIIIYLSYMILRFYDPSNIYTIMLWVKNVEYFLTFFLVVLVLREFTDYKSELIFYVQMIFLIMMLFQLGYRFGLINIGNAPRYRIGLPLTSGVSSNPAGFVLGAYIIFISEVVLRFYKKNLFTVVTLLISFVTIFLTISRTNLIALLSVMFLSIIDRSMRSRKGVVIIVFFVTTLFVAYVLLISYIPENSYLWNFLRIIQNPENLMTDSSFGMRYTYHWPYAIERWLSTPFTFLFGTGFGSVKVVDGTIPRLLGNQGFLGFLLFHGVWFLLPLYYFPKNKALKYLLLFAFINGINGETLIVSYRSVQIYVILLAYTIFMYPDNESGSSYMVHKFFNRYFGLKRQYAGRDI